MSESDANARAEHRDSGKCTLCGNEDEGILISVLWDIIRIFICERCVSGFMRLFKKGR